MQLSRASNALNALVSSEQIRFKQMSEAVCTAHRFRDETQERVPDHTIAPATEKPDSHKCLVRNVVL